MTSCLVGVALWALWRVTMRNEPPGVPEPEVVATPREEIQRSDRERLKALLRQTEKKGRGADPAK